MTKQATLFSWFHSYHFLHHVPSPCQKATFERVRWFALTKAKTNCLMGQITAGAAAKMRKIHAHAHTHIQNWGPKTKQVVLLNTSLPFSKCKRRVVLFYPLLSFIMSANACDSPIMWHKFNAMTELCTCTPDLAFLIVQPHKTCK